MRTFIPLALALTLSLPAYAAQQPQYPVGSTERETRLLAVLGPMTKTWVRTEAGREAQANKLSEANATAAAKAVKGVNAADVDKLAFLVLMQAARSTETSIRDQQTELDGYNARKKQITDQIAKAKAAKPPTPTADLEKRLAATIEVVGIAEMRLKSLNDRRATLVAMVGNELKKVPAAQEALVGKYP